MAYRGIPLQSAYCGAKHAIRGFTESVRTELRHDDSAVTVSQVHLPALNTPQFRWVRHRLPREPKPVPPIFQPELAAEAVCYAADHGTRELYLGGPTVVTVLANKLASGLVERYLARTGFADQQSDEPAQSRPDNLFEPVPGDHGAHGVFGEVAKARSWQWEVRARPRLVAAASGLLAAAGLATAAKRR